MLVSLHNIYLEVLSVVSEPTIKAPEKIKLQDVVTPIFDAAMGQRFTLARMKRLWDQRQVAALLGLHARTVSEMEAGKLAVPRFAFSVSKLEQVFGPLATSYILLGKNAEVFNFSDIYQKFNYTKHKLEAKKRAPSARWNNKQIRDGKPAYSTYEGIPHEVWNLANKIYKEQQNNQSSPIKQKGKKSGSEK